MKKKPSQSDSVPGATIRGTYNTYEDRTRRDLVKALGHVVDLELEDLVQIEIGGWGTLLKLNCRKGVEVSVKHNPDGSTRIYLTKPAKQKELNKSVAAIVEGITK
jgi:hypothetical protein